MARGKRTFRFDPLTTVDWAMPMKLVWEEMVGAMVMSGAATIAVP